MKEKLYTIPLNDAIDAQTECPFCFIERKAEEDLMDFVLGSASSYMESDIRDQTDQYGFCRSHFKKMLEYGNTLGNGWILKTHYARTIKEMKQQFHSFKPGKSSLFKSSTENTISDWILRREKSCYICNQFEDTFDRYMDTFFYLYKNDETFKSKVHNSKGFCLSHFGHLCTAADSHLKNNELTIFYEEMFQLMETNMERIHTDVSWLIEMFDYQNQNADWKNSKDALPRAMQKLKGGFPADPVYKMKK